LFDDDDVVVVKRTLSQWSPRRWWIALGRPRRLWPVPLVFYRHCVAYFYEAWFLKLQKEARNEQSEKRKMDKSEISLAKAKFERRSLRRGA